MKIAILTSEYISEANWHGGLANYLSRVVDGLLRRGHQVHIFVYSNKQEIIDRGNLKIHRIFFSAKTFWIPNLITFKLFPGFVTMIIIAYKFRKYFLEFAINNKFDVIHSSSCQTPALFLNSKKIGIPIVTRISSLMRLCQIADERKNLLDMFFINRAEKYLIKKSDKVFAPSKLIKNKIKEEFGFEIEVIESPAYFDEPKKLDFLMYDKFFKNKKYLLFYGTLSRLKGVEFISKIIYKFLSNNKDYYFGVIGKSKVLRGRKLSIEYLLEKAKEHKDRIIYINSLNHKKLIPIIKKARAILLPSMIDNLPNTCIESMSLSKIVVGTYDGGYDQLIDNGKSGFLVDYGDSKKLIKILNNICNFNKKHLIDMENKASRTIKDRLNFENKIIELENYYIKAIKEFKKNEK